MANPAKDLIQLSALIDGELNGAEAGKVRERLAESETLQKEYRRIKEICDLLECWDRFDMHNVAASPSYEAKLHERLLKLLESTREKSSRVIRLKNSSRN